jgi:hypothetical protein
MLVLLLLATAFAYVGARAAMGSQGAGAAKMAAISFEDGDYLVDVALEGGSGRATVDSPAQVHVTRGEATATIVWSSPHYDYMLVEGTTYLPINTEGNSTFEIPVVTWDEPFAVIGDTTAMSQPHEIDYLLTFDSASASRIEGPQNGTANEAHWPLVPMVALCAAAGGTLFLVLRRRKRSQG